MHVAANYTIQAMLHLTKEEFTTPEREQRLGVMVDYIFLFKMKPKLYFNIYFICRCGLNGTTVFCFCTVDIWR